jgi:hypothetical protein
MNIRTANNQGVSGFKKRIKQYFKNNFAASFDQFIYCHPDGDRPPTKEELIALARLFQPGTTAS